MGGLRRGAAARDTARDPRLTCVRPGLRAEGPPPGQRQGSWKGTPTAGFAKQLCPRHGQTPAGPADLGWGHHRALPARMPFWLGAGSQGNVLENPRFPFVFGMAIKLRQVFRGTGARKGGLRARLPSRGQDVLRVTHVLSLGKTVPAER